MHIYVYFCIDDVCYTLGKLGELIVSPGAVRALDGSESDLISVAQLQQTFSNERKTIHSIIMSFNVECHL